ncbi:flippase-like domain-containing protein [Patescibacteria group bacterium]|nr:flippase-like domain-containing protein [Patescibacteria group bacterium]
MKKFLFYTLTLAAGIIIFILVIGEVGGKEIAKAMAYFPFWKWAVVTATGLISFCVGILRWRFIIKILTGKNLPLKLITMAKTIGWTIAYITPISYIGGEPHKIHLLKDQADIDWEPAGASVIIDEVLELSVALLFLVVGVIFLFLKFSMPAILWLFLGGAMATCITLWLIFWRQTKSGKGFVSFFIRLFSLDKIKWVNGIQDKVKNAEKQTRNFFHYHKRAFGAALALAFLERFILIITFWLMVEFLGGRTNIFQIMGIMSLTVAVNFLPLPASLGGQEASQTIVFGIFGLGAGTGLAFSLILRVLCLAGVVVGLIFLLNFELKIVKQKIAQAGERLNNFFGRF